MPIVEELTSEEQIMYQCLNPNNLKSFFLFAGAGSGKTKSLVTILKKFKDEYSQELKSYNQKIAVITYTNAACETIKERLDFDDTFIVSTIHSFAWELIRTFQKDIKKWVTRKLENDIADLENEISSAKKTSSKKYLNNVEKLNYRKDKLSRIDEINIFSYEPNGLNDSKNSLNHSQVIEITADFLTNKQIMQTLLIKKHPILLIDESQDTSKYLIDAFFAVEEKNKNSFCLGLFGDTMQRIYFDGKKKLDNIIPEDWARPEKQENFRSKSRIIELANKIRLEADGRQQLSVNSECGFVRLFVVDTNNNDNKEKVEKNIRKQMATITNDELWNQQAEIKILTLEHHMAAVRGGFATFFDALNSIEKYKTGLLDGTLAGVSFFLNIILPLVDAKRNNNKLLTAKLIKQYSPLLSKNNLMISPAPCEELKKANKAVNNFFDLFEDSVSPKLLDIIKEIKETGLFELPEIFTFIAENRDMLAEKDSEKIQAWKIALNCDFTEFEAYASYVGDESTFGTHQGIKGLEFERVMAIIDDEESRGNWFKYDKLFGISELSETDIKNQNEGSDSSVDRVRRLFYVICTRAKESLTVVAYTREPKLLKEKLLSFEWFMDNEIIVI